MDEHVSVVGGGIIGLTTATLLELEGYDTTVYTKEIPYDDTGVPSVATNYAAASVKPVLVELDDYAEAVDVSDRFFSKLEDGEIVRRQDNFELYDDGADAEAEDADVLRRYRTLDEYDGTVPHRDDGDTDGYVHEVFFVEMPEYVPALYDLYRREGGEVVRSEVSLDDVPELDGVVVNATGYGNLFDDDAVEAKRGHLIEVDTDERVRDVDGEPFSYSYYTDDGFVYAYPRDDCLLLGGSAQDGDEVDGEWVGEETDDSVEVGGVEVPARIVELNRELIESKTGIDITDYPMSGDYGYRPYRHGGVRTEKETYDGKEVVHCYGHGGAGVTLSWYSADDVRRILTGADERGYDLLDGTTLR